MPLISDDCGEGYSCSSNRCIASVDPCAELNAICAPQGKECIVKPDGTGACWYRESFDDASPIFENTTAETNSYYQVHDDLSIGHNPPGYKGYISWNHYSPDISKIDWSVRYHGHVTPSNAGSNKMSDGNFISMSNRGEHECWYVDEMQKRCWRNRFEVSGFEGGASMIAFDYKPFSTLIKTYNNIQYYNNHMKLRLYVDEIDVPVAVFVTIPSRYVAGDGVTREESTVTFDLSRIALPEGVVLKDIKKIIIKPEYVNLDGDDGGNLTMFGQTFIDNFRWISAE